MTVDPDCVSRLWVPNTRSRLMTGACGPRSCAPRSSARVPGLCAVRAGARPWMPFFAPLSPPSSRPCDHAPLSRRRSSRFVTSSRSTSADGRELGYARLIASTGRGSPGTGAVGARSSSSSNRERLSLGRSVAFGITGGSGGDPGDRLSHPRSDISFTACRRPTQRPLAQEEICPE